MCLAATVTLYWAALVRGAWTGENLFRSDSLLKNEATELSGSLEEANRKATSFAREMQERAIRDDLTGLLNRRGFSAALERELRDGVEGALLIVDLDGFKAVNDSFGHKLGDRVLVEVARRILETAQPDALVARLGGDEFAIFHRSGEAVETPGILATRIVAAMAIPFSRLDAGRVGVCIGIYAGPRVDLDEMLLNADTALYAAKREGRNSCRVFDDILRRQARIRRDVERDLPGALLNESLEVWYQPIMGGRGRSLDSVEALLRWRHPAHGWISPEEIVATAAMSGHSEALLRFILREAARTLRVLETLDLAHVRVAINVSPRELAQIQVDDLVLAAMERHGVSPARLEIEVTEEVAINPRLVKDKLSRLAQNDVRLAIDDFGSGYSSLGSLQHLHVNRVKIDRSFVTGIAASSAPRSLIDAVLRVSEGYGFDVVAEGVETKEDLDALRELGCSLMQGYYFGRPMPFEQIVAWARAYQSRSELALA